MTRDFTLKAYAGIIDQAQSSGYKPLRVKDWMSGEFSAAPAVVVLRHDVDRRPENALAMAELELSRGALATYYFRCVGSAFNPGIIRKIAAMGHEIGYHYEDFHLANYDPAKAWLLFEKHLASLREIAPIETIAMHGSPLAKFNNMEIWKHHSFESSGVKDCILSVDWSDFVFFTDTGRSFDATLTNLRDTIGGKHASGVATSVDVAAYLAKEKPRHVQVNIHPERWSDAIWPWVRQLATDRATNTAKLILRMLPRKT
jgi:hypothetical protein